MPWNNPEDVVEYRHPSWLPGSLWRFKSHMSGRDRRGQMRRLGSQDFEYDPLEERRMRRQGKRYVPKITSETLMSGREALIIAQSRGWEGEEFRLPGDFKVNGQIHPLAGQIPPCNEDWIPERDDEELKDIEAFLNDLYEGITEDEADSFPGSSASVDGPRDSGLGEGGVPVPVGTFGSSFDAGPALESE